MVLTSGVDATRRKAFPLAQDCPARWSIHGAGPPSAGTWRASWRSARRCSPTPHGRPGGPTTCTPTPIGPRQRARRFVEDDDRPVGGGTSSRLGLEALVTDGWIPGYPEAYHERDLGRALRRRGGQRRTPGPLLSMQMAAGLKPDAACSASPSTLPRSPRDDYLRARKCHHSSDDW